MTIKEIIQRLSILRTKAKLSARALSLMIGKNSTYITKMEAGEFTPNLSTLLEIIEVCNSTAEEFFSQNFDNYKQDNELLQVITKMNEKRKRTLLEFLTTI